MTPAVQITTIICSTIVIVFLTIARMASKDDQNKK